MSSLPRRSVRLIAAVIVLVLVGQFWAIASERVKTTSRRRAHTAVAAAAPIPLERFTPDPPRPKPRPRVVRRAPAKPESPHHTVAARRQPTVFSDLGACVDQ